MGKKSSAKEADEAGWGGGAGGDFGDLPGSDGLPAALTGATATRRMTAVFERSTCFGARPSRAGSRQLQILRRKIDF